MNTEQARFNMVEQQIRTWEVLDQTVLDLLYVVRREEFVPAAYRALAFSDLEIPLGSGNDDSEKMLMPKMEARILQELAIKSTDHVLEIGTGSGYMAALLAATGQQVVTVEINPALKAMAEQNLRAASVANVAVMGGDGAQGWGNDQFDVIAVSGSTPILPDNLMKQLKIGGRMFVVIGDAPVMAARLITCEAPGAFSSIDLFETNIAPLKNAAQPARFIF